MRIKEVCKLTGLTDKAIRTYIKEALVFPDYDENYAGRKSYNFSESDVTALTHIAVLRKYNFSIKEIRALFNHEAEATDLLNTHISEMSADVNADINIINSMVNVINEHPSSSREMCEMLNTPEIANKQVPIVDNKAYVKKQKRNNVLIVTFSLVLILGFVIAGIIVMISSLFVGGYEDDFVGLCVITSDEPFTLHDKNYDILELSDNIIVLDDVDNPNALTDINSKFSSFEYSLSKNRKKLNFKAEINTDKDYVVFVPIYMDENREYYGADPNNWAKVDNSELFSYVSTKTKAKNLTFSYSVKVNQIKEPK